MGSRADQRGFAERQIIWIRLGTTNPYFREHMADEIKGRGENTKFNDALVVTPAFGRVRVRSDRFVGGAAASEHWMSHAWAADATDLSLGANNGPDPDSFVWQKAVPRGRRIAPPGLRSRGQK